MSDTRANLSNAELDALIESMVDRIEQLQAEVERLREQRRGVLNKRGNEYGKES